MNFVVPSCFFIVFFFCITVMNDFIVCFLLLPVYSFICFTYELQILDFHTERLHVKTIMQED